MNTRPDEPPDPVFVLSPARSCSSLVVTMLGQHPQLYGFPELRLFRAQTVAELLIDPPTGAGMPARERTAGLTRALAQLHEHHQTSEAINRAWRWLEHRRNWETATVLDHLLALIAPLIGVEKSPETSLNDAALARVAHAYPTARYIHLVRHPWTTVASMITAWAPLRYWHVTTPHAPEFCAKLWCQQHSRITTFGRTIEPARLIRVRAEDITNHPTPTLPKITRWLQIDDDQESLTRMCEPERSVYSRPGPPQAHGGLDPAFLERPRLRPIDLPPSLAPPTGWAIEPQTCAAVIALARQFGYGPSSDERSHIDLTTSTRLARYRVRTRLTLGRHHA